MTTTPGCRCDNPALVAPPRQTALEEPLALDGGRDAAAAHTVNFETYGTLSAAPGQRDPRLPLADQPGARGGPPRAGDPRPGWWDAAIGPGKMLDTDRYFVICADALGGGPATGPASPDPATGRPLRAALPGHHRAGHGARRSTGWCSGWGSSACTRSIGGCLGGQQAIEWAIQHPDQVGNAVVITTTPATSAHTIAIFTVMRHLIRADPAWNGGDYYGESFPADGLGAAVAAAVPLWMSREAMEPASAAAPSGDGRRYTLGPEFEVEAFIARLAAPGPATNSTRTGSCTSCARWSTSTWNASTATWRGLQAGHRPRACS